jgi:hypothetical protein
MKNLASTTAGVSSSRGGENVLDDSHLFVGEEIQWRIFHSVALCIPPFNVLLYVGLYITSLHKQKYFKDVDTFLILNMSGNVLRKIKYLRLEETNRN